MCGETASSGAKSTANVPTTNLIDDRINYFLFVDVKVRCLGFPVKTKKV
jgi:hypothetical protein